MRSAVYSLTKSSLILRCALDGVGLTFKNLANSSVVVNQVNSSPISILKAFSDADDKFSKSRPYS